jgi:hypothetical protein
MNKLFYTFLWYLLSINLTFADGWILWDFANDRTEWEKDTETALRNWDIHIEDIPNILKLAIDFFITIAWTVAIIFIIIWAYKILLGSLEQDKTKWKDTIIMALGWFAIASLAWLIIKFILDNLS